MTSKKKKKRIRAKYKQSDIIQSRKTFWHMATNMKRLLRRTLHVAALREGHASASQRTGARHRPALARVGQPRAAPRPRDFRPSRMQNASAAGVRAAAQGGQLRGSSTPFFTRHVVRTELRRGLWGPVSNPNFNTSNARSPRRLQCLCKTGHAQWPPLKAAEKVCSL